jgi:outer membrane protein assembly factor BamB
VEAASGRRDLVVLLDGSTPKMAWLDGSTGKTLRTQDVGSEIIYCITPRVLGLLRDDDTKLDMIDARSGTRLDTVTAELGVSSLQRTGDKVFVSEADESSKEHSIPGCARDDCDFPFENVPYGKIMRDAEIPSLVAPVAVGRACADELDHDGVHYEVAEVSGWAVVTAERDETRIWAKRIPIDDSGHLMRCALAVDDRSVAVLRSETASGDLTIVQLDPADGDVIAETSIGQAGRTSIAVSAFFSDHSRLFVHFSTRKQLIAFDPEKREVAWRR